MAGTLDVEKLGLLSWFLTIHAAAMEEDEDSLLVSEIADARGEIQVIYAIALYQNRTELSEIELIDARTALSHLFEVLPT